MEEIFGTEPLLSHKGQVTIEDAFKGVKFVGIYFSMHNCPPCREFTPIFGSLYEEMNADEKLFEVVFCSGDKTQEVYDQYYGEQPWLSLPFKDARLAGIAKRFEVKGVPRLIIVKPDGTVIASSAVDKVKNEGPGAIEEFLAAE